MKMLVVLILVCLLVIFAVKMMVPRKPTKRQTNIQNQNQVFREKRSLNEVSAKNIGAATKSNIKGSSDNVNFATQQMILQQSILLDSDDNRRNYNAPNENDNSSNNNTGSNDSSHSASSNDYSSSYSSSSSSSSSDSGSSSSSFD